MQLDYMVNNCRLTCNVIAFQVVGSRSRATAGKAQDSPTGQAKHPNKDTKGSAKSAQAKDYTAAKQSDGFWQRVKRGATDALHHLPRTQVMKTSSSKISESEIISAQHDYLEAQCIRQEGTVTDGPAVRMPFG